MLVFIWAALLFSVSATNNNTNCSNESTGSTSPEVTVSQHVTSTTMMTQSVNSTSDSISVEPVNNTDRNETKPSDLLTELLTIVKQPQVIIAFFIGVLLSATICCLITKCNRKKKRGSRQMADSLEMVTAEAVPLMHDGQAVNDGDDGTHEPEAADGGAGAVEPKDVEYSNIDFSVLKRRSLTEAEETQDPTETEYAEIKKDTAGEESEAMEGTKEEGGMTGEETNEKEPEQCVPVKDEEDVAVYSNVYEVMAESDGGDTLTENS